MAKKKPRVIDLNQLKPLAGGNFTSFGNMLKKIGENDKNGVQKGAGFEFSPEVSAELIRVLHGE